ncbi:hypothetical protein HMPREF0645_1094 [Hallella bergensis DSM 17361]|uniref:Uncharacterized protein n=1 Tax=Hallella bergensis DSM 17361 TaxID=585502 RepID=D1PVV9_9BACT|nr:hypothetical protein HMPREF0645_1094 [Hallella bergensis DSM 17361]
MFVFKFSKFERMFVKKIANDNGKPMHKTSKKLRKIKSYIYLNRKMCKKLYIKNKSHNFDPFI